MSDEAIARTIRRAHLSALLHVSMKLAESLELDDVLQAAIEGAVQVLELDTGAIYLCEGHGALRLGAATPPLPPEVPDEARRAALAHHPHLAAAFETGRPVIVSDVRRAEFSEWERAVVDVRGIASLLYVPLLFRGVAEGAIIVGAYDYGREYSAEDIDLCRTLSTQIALALSNARLYESAQHSADELTRAYDATLEGWSLALEMRDHETQGHTRRATDLTLAIATDLGIADEDLPHVRRGALLHDIGKMAVPDAILNKPGALTDQEWAIMRAHPIFAQEFLSRIEYLAPALDIPYAHHERWDGSGYPRGLKGEDIPLAARIFAVIDVYDALTSDRPYRPAWSPDAALEYIAEHAGTQFDPAVVRSFLERVGRVRH